MRSIRLATILIIAVGAGAAAVAVAAPGKGRDHGGRASAVLFDGSGAPVGTVEFRQRAANRGARVNVHARNLPPGFHGFHVHTVGKCERPAFTSAMGHLAMPGQDHPNHRGDLPVLLINADRSGRLVAVTDRFTLSDLRDADGSAVIVHANRDNYANIPTDRYDPDPDRTTLDTGDAGARLACGVVR
jgi:Cu-Zn family superoxide dismutase